jgi:hypothetical protein
MTRAGEGYDDLAEDGASGAVLDADAVVRLPLLRLPSAPTRSSIATSAISVACSVNPWSARTCSTEAGAGATHATSEREDLAPMSY